MALDPQERILQNITGGMMATYDIKVYEPIVNRYAEMRARKRTMALDPQERIYIQQLQQAIVSLQQQVQDLLNWQRETQQRDAYERGQSDASRRGRFGAHDADKMRMDDEGPTPESGGEK